MGVKHYSGDLNHGLKRLTIYGRVKKFFTVNEHMDADLLNQYRNINWDRVLMRRLGEAGSLEIAKPYFDRVKNFLDKLLDDRVIAILPPNAISEIEAYTRSFISYLDNDILSYSDVSQRGQKITNIKNETGNLLNILSKYQVYFDVLPVTINNNPSFEKEILDIKNQRLNDIEELKNIRNTFLKNSPGLTQANNIANELVSKNDSIGVALRKVEEFIKSNEKAVETLLQKNATSFSQKSQEHISYIKERVPIFIFKKINFWGLNLITQPAWYLGSIIWLICAILSGLMVLLIISYFVFTNHDLTIGAGLLRLSAIVVPSYFTLIFVEQFVLHRKLYEFYKFKDIALQTMILLRKEFVNDHTSKEELLSRSMAVIFSEPSMKEEGKYDKQMVMEILRMVAGK